MNLIIYFIAFLEGFTTLSVEIVALRYFTPLVGSNSISTSIILGVILLALSYGYYIGGKISAKGIKLKQRLVINLLISALYYFFISFIVLEYVVSSLLGFTGNYFLSILVSSILLFFIPVFLASQTIPILAELIKGGYSGEKIGKLLFFSTVGSFLGAVLTSSLLFPLLGVVKTGIISSALLSLCATLVTIFFYKNTKVQVISAVIFIFFLNSMIFTDYENKKYIFSQSNAYHDIGIYDYDDKRIFSLNRAYSSGIYSDSKKSFFSYINEASAQVLEHKPKTVLVIGAAGFTFPNDISEFEFVEKIDVVDVDGSLKEIAEKYFLEKKLSPKITFYPEPSRYFINNIEEKYDFILVDVYSGESIPPQVLTYDFFQRISQIGDKIYLNLIFDVSIESDFSLMLLSTINKALGDSYFKQLNGTPGSLGNMMVTNTFNEKYMINSVASQEVYTDNLNSIEIDLFKMRQEIDY